MEANLYTSLSCVHYYRLDQFKKSIEIDLYILITIIKPQSVCKFISMLNTIIYIKVNEIYIGKFPVCSISFYYLTLYDRVSQPELFFVFFFFA